MLPQKHCLCCIDLELCCLIGNIVYKKNFFFFFQPKNQAMAEKAVTPTGVNVIGEELHSKIEENARLHKQVSGIIILLNELRSFFFLLHGCHFSYFCRISYFLRKMAFRKMAFLLKILYKLFKFSFLNVTLLLKVSGT